MASRGLSGGDAAHMALVARERAYRQAIAALYWRAGEAACDVADYSLCGPDGERAVLEAATRGYTLICTASAMEAAACSAMRVTCAD